MPMKIYFNAYQRFLQVGYKHKNSNSGIIVSYNDFKKVYPLSCFDVSKQESKIYRGGSTDDTEIKILWD